MQHGNQAAKAPKTRGAAAKSKSTESVASPGHRVSGALLSHIQSFASIREHVTAVVCVSKLWKKAALTRGSWPPTFDVPGSKYLVKLMKHYDPRPPQNLIVGGDMKQFAYFPTLPEPWLLALHSFEIECDPYFSLSTVSLDDRAPSLRTVTLACHTSDVPIIIPRGLEHFRVTKCCALHFSLEVRLNAKEFALRSLDLQATTVRDPLNFYKGGSICDVANFPNLVSLRLARFEIYSESMRSAPTFPMLRKLDLFDSEVPLETWDAFIKPLAAQLEELRLPACDTRAKYLHVLNTLWTRANNLRVLWMRTTPEVDAFGSCQILPIYLQKLCLVMETMQQNLLKSEAEPLVVRLQTAIPRMTVVTWCTEEIEMENAGGGVPLGIYVLCRKPTKSEQ